MKAVEELLWNTYKIKKLNSPILQFLWNHVAKAKEGLVVVLKFMHKINIQIYWPSKLSIDDQYNILKEAIWRSIILLFLSNKNLSW